MPASSREQRAIRWRGARRADDIRAALMQGDSVRLESVQHQSYSSTATMLHEEKTWDC
jgi:hypothetical protein